MKAAYCNDEYLVMHTNGAPNHKDGLKLIPHPPSGGDNYATSCVTRSYHLQYTVYKVPLFPILLPQASPTNNMAAFVGQTDPAMMSTYGLPSTGAVAVSVSGQSLFPIFTNNEAVSHEMCEMDKCSAHAGQGFDYHYHGDPFGSVNGTCMYSLLDYESPTAHPPLIGKAKDIIFYFAFSMYLHFNQDGALMDSRYMAVISTSMQWDIQFPWMYAEVIFITTVMGT